MLLVDDLAAGGTKNLRHTPRGLVTLTSSLQIFGKLYAVKKHNDKIITFYVRKETSSYDQ